jgi:hypothetical protein
MARSDIHFGDRGVRGKVAVMGLFATLGILLGCDSKPAYEDTRHLENPPPKPPNCPDLPELKNITLKNGAVADVRIIQFRDTKMYFPVDLINSHFIDQKTRWGGFTDEHDLQKFSPDIYFKECPGIVHKLVENNYRTWPFIIVDPNPMRRDRPFAKNLRYAEGMGGVFITSNVDTQSPNTHAAMLGFFDDHFDWKSNLLIMIRTIPKYRGRWQHSKSVNEFVTWLNTPPSKRDNDALFNLEVYDE